MQTNVNFTSMKLPHLLGDLTHSNQFLKVFSLMMGAVAGLSLCAVLILSNRGPTVVALNSEAQVLSTGSLSSPEKEIRAAIKHYIELRYQWGPEDVKKKLTDAQSMVQANAMKAYLGAIGNVIKFSLERQVSQRVYAQSLNVDLAKKSVLVQGDRLTSIQNLKAASDLHLELSFDYGPRTKENPWGVYVTMEKEN